MPNNYISDVTVDGVVNDIHDSRLENIATVATTGNYSDLNGRPTIPTALADLSADATHRLVTDSEKSTWNSKGTYSKPSGGIPKTDLSSSVQTSLNLANSALQEEVYKGTVTAATMNGETKSPVNGIIPLGTVLTEHQDISGKANITYVDSEIARVEGEIPSLSGYATQEWVEDQGFAEGADVAAIEAKIPEQATAQNQLADKEFVNSSIATNTAIFRGSFDVVDDLGLTLQATHAQVAAAVKTKVSVTTNNDYVFVFFVNEDTGITEKYDRYKCVLNASGQFDWGYEYTLNNSSFTAVQWAAINSEITAARVGEIAANTTARHTHSNKTVLDDITQSAVNDWNTVTGKYSKPSSGIPKTDLASGVQSSLDKADSALQSHQDISSKADKVLGAVDGNLAGLDSTGNLTDTGFGIEEAGTLEVVEADALDIITVLGSSATDQQIPTAKAVADKFGELGNVANLTYTVVSTF